MSSRIRVVYATRIRDLILMKNPRKSFKPISKLSTNLIYQLGGEKYASFIAAFMAWKNIVGELLASHSHPFKYENHVLFVAVHNNTWMQELMLLKANIISKYNTILEEGISEIVFMISSPKRKCKKRK